MVIIESSRFGSLEAAPDRTLDVVGGLLGFPDVRTFHVVEIPDEEQYFWLQSGEVPELAFLVIRPWAFFPDYEITVPDAAQEQIGLTDPTESEVFLLLTVHRGQDGEPTDITANLLGPIVVNTTSRTACQLVLDNSSYRTRHSLVSV